jgi:GTP-binding protein EngB required for normal cell division
MIALDRVQDVLSSVEEFCRRYGITALEDFLGSCRTFAGDKALNIAILGRFKAGKSSFLNHLVGRPLFPVGAIPVTTVVTEIRYGFEERADVDFLDGHAERVPVGRISEFISETAHPENAKRVARVRVELPSMERYRSVRFVDTPSLGSIFGHNTDASLEWLPNVGLALVAVGVDPPLSQHDVKLIRNLQRYTPNICLLLTKVDVLEEKERVQVKDFVQAHLARCWNGSVPVFAYPVRPGFEDLRLELDRRLLSRVRAEAGEQRAAILKSAEVADSEREQLRLILGQKESLDDSRLALRLIVRHAAGATRTRFEALLQPDEAPIWQRLLAGLDAEFPSWARSLSVVIERFDDWLQAILMREMADVSTKHREEFIDPVRHVSRQLSQSLQDFRNRLSERMLETLGVPLRTSEVDLRPNDPRTPDVRVGKIFDRNWELLSFLIPMVLVKGVVKKHFQHKVAEAVFTNLSRLVSQWQDIVNASLLALEKEAGRRLDGLITTIERLIAAAGQEASRIRADLERIEALKSSLQESEDRILEAQ